MECELYVNEAVTKRNKYKEDSIASGGREWLNSQTCLLIT